MDHHCSTIIGGITYYYTVSFMSRCTTNQRWGDWNRNKTKWLRSVFLQPRLWSSSQKIVYQQPMNDHTHIPFHKGHRNVLTVSVCYFMILPICLSLPPLFLSSESKKTRDYLGITPDAMPNLTGGNRLLSLFLPPDAFAQTTPTFELCLLNYCLSSFVTASCTVVQRS